MEYQSPANLLAAQPGRAPTQSATELVAPPCVQTAPELRAVIVDTDPAWTQALLEAFTPLAPRVVIALSPCLPARSLRIKMTAQRPDAICLTVAELERAAINPADSLEPALIVLGEDTASTTASSLLRGGVQEYWTRPVLSAPTWTQRFRQAIIRQEGRRERAEASSGGTLSSSVLATLPCLLWTGLDEASLALHPTAIDLPGNLHEQEILLASAGRLLGNLAEAPAACAVEPVSLETNAGTRNFLLIARRQKMTDGPRCLVMGVELPGALPTPNQPAHAENERLSHALKNPLSAIVLGAQICRTESNLETHREMWQIVEESAEKIQEILKARFPTRVTES